MSTPTTIRLTASGACASCGLYPGLPRRCNCDPDRVQHVRLEDSHRARIDSRLSAIARTYARQQGALVRSR